MEQNNYHKKDLLIQDVETVTSNPTQNNNNTTTNRSQIEEPKITLYKRRFLALILFSLCTSINSCGWICFAPIGDVLQKNYGVSIFIINYLSQIYMIMYLPLNFPSVYALDKLGLRWGVLIGIALTALGLWVRCLINYSFAWVIVGQTILAIAQPFTYNAPAKLSANWFGEKERVYATSFGANASTFGIAAGFFLPSVFISDDISQMRILLDNKPPTCPTVSQQMNSEVMAQFSLKKDCVQLVRNKSFVFTGLASSLMMGFFFAFTTVLEQMVVIYNFSLTQTSYLGSIYQFAGIGGGIVTSIVLTYFPRYKPTSIVIASLTFLSYMMVHFAIYSQSFAFLVVAIIFNGFFCLSIFSVAFELGVELSFPVGEASSGGLINSVANVIGFVVVFIMTPILNNNQGIDVMICSIIFGVMLLMALSLYVFTDFKLKRAIYEQEQQMKRSQLQQQQASDIQSERLKLLAVYKKGIQDDLQNKIDY
eukprot:403356370